MLGACEGDALGISDGDTLCPRPALTKRRCHGVKSDLFDFPCKTLFEPQEGQPLGMLQPVHDPPTPLASVSPCPFETPWKP